MSSRNGFVQLGCGHPVGGTGVRQVLDAYRQVTDSVPRRERGCGDIRRG